MKKDEFLDSAIKRDLFNKEKIFNNILEKIEKEKIFNNLDLLLLMTINKHDSYGIEIIKDLSFTLKNTLKNYEGIIYPILHNLENQNFIKSYWINGDINRKYYSITKLGKNYLKEKQAISKEILQGKTAILKEDFSWT